MEVVKEPFKVESMELFIGHYLKPRILYFAPPIYLGLYSLVMVLKLNSIRWVFSVAQQKAPTYGRIFPEFFLKQKMNVTNGLLKLWEYGKVNLIWNLISIDTRFMEMICSVQYQKAISL